MKISGISEDSRGGEITTATRAHIAASTPVDFPLNTVDRHTCNSDSTGSPTPATENGKLYASEQPDLGVKPDLDRLGDPVAVYA